MKKLIPLLLDLVLVIGRGLLLIWGIINAARSLIQHDWPAAQAFSLFLIFMTLDLRPSRT